MTETEARALFVDTAKSYLGYSESSGKHRQIIDLYNSKSPLPRNYKVIKCERIGRGVSRVISYRS